MVGMRFSSSATNICLYMHRYQQHIRAAADSGQKCPALYTPHALHEQLLHCIGSSCLIMMTCAFSGLRCWLWPLRVTKMSPTQRPSTAAGRALSRRHSGWFLIRPRPLLHMKIKHPDRYLYSSACCMYLAGRCSSPCMPETFPGSSVNTCLMPALRTQQASSNT